MIRLLTLLFISAALFCDAQTEPTTAKELVSSMFNTYKSVWYQNLTFTQKTQVLREGVMKDEIWYEAMDLQKGTLVIKYHSKDSGDGLIFRNDSILVYADNKLTVKRANVHDLIVLGFTVYTISPEATLAKLKLNGYNTDSFKKEDYDSRPHYVVGDETAQFWIDAKTLLFTKLRKKHKDGRLSEIEFKGYQKLGKGWIESEVTFLNDGKMTMNEKYEDVQTPQKLPATFYNQSVFNKLTW